MRAMILLFLGGCALPVDSVHYESDGAGGSGDDVAWVDSVGGPNLCNSSLESFEVPVECKDDRFDREHGSELVHPWEVENEWTSNY